MTKSKKEYLAWITCGVCGTTWRSNTIRDAVETCSLVASQDWGGLRGLEVWVNVYDVTGISVGVTATGYVITEEETEISPTEIPPLFFVTVDFPKLRKNGHASGEIYRSKMKEAVYTALQSTPEYDNNEVCSPRN